MRRKVFTFVLLSCISILLVLASSVIDIRRHLNQAIGFLAQTEDVIFSTGLCDPQIGGRTTREGRFFKYSDPDFRFYAYSAFYDDRRSLLSGPVVRVIAIGDNITEQSKGFKLFCVFGDLNATNRVRVEGEGLECGPGFTLNRRHAVPYVITCPCPNFKPRFLSIETSLHDNRTKPCMPIEYLKKRRYKNRKAFSVCVPVSYGQLDPFHLIEWLEMQRLLGVQHVSVYDLYLSDETRRVFNHYARVEPDFVEFRKIHRIHPFEYHTHILELAVSLNDCLYRNMFQSKRIIVSDFDEFIKPQKHSHLNQLVNILQKTIPSNKSVHYVVRNNYFFLESEPDADESPYLMFLRYRQKAPVSEPFHRIKPIILTEACTHLFSHQCLGLTAEYADRELLVSVDPTVALNRHYRRCPLLEAECKAALDKTSTDDAMLQFKSVLRRRVAGKILAIIGSLPEDF